MKVLTRRSGPRHHPEAASKSPKNVYARDSHIVSRRTGNRHPLTAVTT